MPPKPWPKPPRPGPIIRRPNNLLGCEVLLYTTFYEIDYTPPALRERSLIEVDFGGSVLVDAAMDVFGGMVYDEVDRIAYSKFYQVIGLKGRFEFTMRKKSNDDIRRLIWKMGYYYGAINDGFWRIGWNQMEAYLKTFCDYKS